MADNVLLAQAKGAIDRLFKDTSVSKARTRALLEDLVEHIEVLVEGLSVDETDDEEE